MTAEGGNVGSTPFVHEGFFRGALESNPDCVLVLDLSGNIQFINRNGLAILEAEDLWTLAGVSWLELWGPAARPRAQTALASALAGETERFTAPARTFQGAVRHFDTIVSPLGEDGEPVALMVTARDVTDIEGARLEAEAHQREIAQQAAVLRSAADMAKLAGWEVDYRRGVLLQSEEGVRLLRGGPEHRVLPLQKSLEIYEPEDHERLSALWEQTRTTGERMTYDAPMRRYDGSRGWIRIFGEPVYEGGECVGLRGVGMDVTDEKAAEETLARTERRMSLAVQLSDMEVYELDFETETLVREVPAVSVFDEAPAEEDFWPDLALLADRRDRRRVRAEWARTVAGEAPFRSEFRVRRQDGRQIWTYCVAELVRDPSGRPLRLVAAMRDVTSRKRRELQKRHTMAQMREHEERQELLLGELNHRVKNTLTAVQSVAVQTLTDNRDLPAARELFVERLLALSSTHNLLVKHAWQGASFHELVELTMKPYGRPYDCEGPDLSFDANFAVSIGMALHELATNALKHGAWQGDGRVDISVQAHDGQVRIVWRETGGPPVVAPERRGFGSRLLQRGVAAELGGTVEMDFAPTGLICTIEAPISHRLQVVEAG